jgi:hypothetical protein
MSIRRAEMYVELIELTGVEIERDRADSLLYLLRALTRGVGKDF